MSSVRRACEYFVDPASGPAAGLIAFEPVATEPEGREFPWDRLEILRVR